ncbi:MAG TPA: T9SS type A sorting domain-containing protein, partial [Rhodothermales bacterium]
WFLNMSRVILARSNNDGDPLPPNLWATAADTSYFLTGPDGTNQIHQTMGQRGFPINAEAVDFHQDGRDELIVYYRQLQVYEVDDDYAPNQIASFGTSSDPGQVGRHMLAVADLDADNDLMNESSAWRPEIIVVTNDDISDDGGISVDGILRIKVYSWDPDIGFPSIRESQLTEYRIDPSGARPIALAALDAGDNGIRVGQPTRYAKTEIVRPLVILNAPPTHFDVFDDAHYDVNHCYGEEDCACREDLARCFQAEYMTETERSISMETELLTDWSVATTIDGGFEIPFGDELGIGVDIELTATYGEGFRRKNSTRQTFTVRQAVQATRDDWIYAMIVNYTIWEYPLYVGGEQVSNIAVVIPKLQTRAWFDSKSWNAFDYIPTHEVGNILSYRSIASPDENSLLASAIRWDTGDQITLSSTSDVSWALTSEGETETEVENSVNMGIGGSADFDIPIPFIPNISVEGDYSTTTVNTRNVKVRDTKGMSVTFGNIDQGIGNVRYNVIPYVYWAKNGALVLDYAVNPELAQPGFEGTWWQTRYGERSDPAFILPWKLDREKGADITEAQTRQTREILFDPIEPEAGDVVTIKVRVHNWSLLPTPGPVEVQFFVGDPAAGGTPIVGTQGETSVFVEQLTDRGSGKAQMQWQIPAGIGFFPRIYAVIDPAGAIEEIHEGNNKGWTVLNVTSGPTDVENDGPGELAVSPAIHQNYPNPFSGVTTIAFDLPRPERTTIQVLDLLGREVSRVVDQVFDAGSYNVNFDARGLSSGVYLYRLVAGKTVETRQMMVLK